MRGGSRGRKKKKWEIGKGGMQRKRDGVDWWKKIKSRK